MCCNDHNDDQKENYVVIIIGMCKIYYIRKSCIFLEAKKKSKEEETKNRSGRKKVGEMEDFLIVYNKIG